MSDGIEIMFRFFLLGWTGNWVRREAVKYKGPSFDCLLSCDAAVYANKCNRVEDMFRCRIVSLFESLDLALL